MMRFLLDTHVLIWALVKPDALGPDVRSSIVSPKNEAWFSSASIWEIAIKSRLRRGDFAYRPTDVVEAAVDAGLVELPVRALAAVRVADLPLHHRDPFDRILIAQALEDSLTFLTSDKILRAYSPLVQIV